MRTEISQAKKEANFYLQNVEKGKAIEAMETRKRKRADQASDVLRKSPNCEMGSNIHVATLPTNSRNSCGLHMLFTLFALTMLETWSWLDTFFSLQKHKLAPNFQHYYLKKLLKKPLLTKLLQNCSCNNRFSTFYSVAIQMQIREKVIQRLEFSDESRRAVGGSGRDSVHRSVIFVVYPTLLKQEKKLSSARDSSPAVGAGDEARDDGKEEKGRRGSLSSFHPAHPSLIINETVRDDWEQVSPSSLI